jgi:cell wall integrity and stress response component
LSGGAIAGIVIGCLLGVGALAAAGLWFFFFGRRRNESTEKSPTPESRYDPSTPGTTSETQRQSKGSQMTFMRNFMGSSEPKSATSPNDFLSPNRPFTDNRMKKDAPLYQNGGRHSAVSLRDEEDYSRPVLRVSDLT